ncbi:MAG: AraC family ligand binding domain-containing protein [Ewingella sp.]|uniref:AraC family transcriptional regulator n=1 Tax=Ewingella TaxID=41201 RepID=UPI003365A6AA
MQGVPELFPYDKDCAQFKALPQLPGVELYHAHIDRYAFEPHSHEAFGIGAIEQGAERFRYRGADHLASAGSLVMMNPDEIHTGQSETEGGWLYRMIYIEPQVFEELSGERARWFTDAVRHDPRAARQLSQLLSGLWETNDALTRDGLMLAVTDLLRPHTHVGHRLRSEPAHRFDRVTDYLRENFANNITLDELASLVSLSPYHFLRKFKQQMHVTPHQMLMAIRLNEAKRMLSFGIPAAQVAFSVGLTDQAHLTRAFSNRYGSTPVRYQKQVASGK